MTNSGLGISQGLAWCLTPDNYKDNDVWNSEVNELLNNYSEYELIGKFRRRDVFVNYKFDLCFLIS
jgi:hypothetical protein